MRTLFIKLVGTLAVFFLNFNTAIGGEVINIYKEGSPLNKEIKGAFLYTQSDLILSQIESMFKYYMPDNQKDLGNWSYGTEELFSYLKYAEIQLDKSDKKEVVILFAAPGYCGSGGCSGFLLKLDEGRPKNLGQIFLSGSIIAPTIGPGASPPSGFHDFAISGDDGIYIYSYDAETSRYKPKE